MPVPDADLAGFIGETHAQTKTLTALVGTLLGLLQAADVFDEATIDNVIAFAGEIQPRDTNLAETDRMLDAVRNIARQAAAAIEGN